MLTCTFVAGILMLSDGVKTIPLGESTVIWKGRENNIIVRQAGANFHTVEAKHSYGDAPVEEILADCADKAEIEATKRYEAAE